MLHTLKKLTLVSSIAIMAGCGAGGIPFVSDAEDELRDVVTSLDSQGKVIQTRTQMTGSEMLNLEAKKSDAVIATQNAECWKGVMSNEDQMQITPGMDGNQMGFVGMANANNNFAKAMMFMNPNFKPCALATNSNDVLVAKEQGKTVRSQARWQAAPSLLGIAAGGVTSYKLADSLSDIAVAGINRAGTTVNTNGDGNATDITNNDVEQRADNGSTISDSGNIDQAKGIPVGETDLALSASNPDEEALVDGSNLTCPVLANGIQSVLRPSEPTDDIATVLDGFTCSDTAGGSVLPESA